MCELLGMSANVPTDILFSLTGLMERGGRTGPHKDGWGVGFYEGRGLRVFQDTVAGAESKIAELVKRYPIKSEVVIGHIRHANVGGVSLANTHPFSRELWGQYWCFAHNGQLAGFEPAPGFYRPVGETDSERAFCDLLNRLRTTYGGPVDAEAMLPVLTRACAHYRAHGVFNCLLSNGDWLFSCCSTKLVEITRRAPFGPARLRDADLSVDFHAETTPRDVVTVLATEPLTQDECWEHHAPGTWSLWRLGRCVARGTLDEPSGPDGPASSME